MNSKFIVMVLCGGAIALSPTAIFSQPSRAANTTISCDRPNSQPTTVIISSATNGKPQRDNFLHWYRAFPLPRARQLCQRVQTQIQRRINRGEDIRITTGNVGRRFVVCFAKTTNPDERCNASSEMLFTPIRSDNSNRIEANLLDSSMANPRGQSAGRTYGRVRFFILWY